MGRERESKMGRRESKHGLEAKIAAQGESGAGRVVLTDQMGRLLNTDLQKPAHGKRRRHAHVVLPCGAQLVIDLRHGAVLYRAPREYSIASCPRLTIDEVCAQLDRSAESLQEMERRMETLEGMVMADSGKSVIPPCHEQRSGPVRSEIRDEEGQRYLLDGTDTTTSDARESVGSVDIPNAG